MFVMPVLFGLGCAVAIWFSAYSNDPDAKPLALGLTAVWGLANAAWLLDALWLLPALDWLIGMTALIAWWAHGQRWVAFLVQLVAARLILHVLDLATGHVFLVPYIHGLNALFTLELLAVSYTGMGNGIRVLRSFRAVRLFLRSSPQAKVKG